VTKEKETTKKPTPVKTKDVKENAKAATKKAATKKATAAATGNRAKKATPAKKKSHKSMEPEEIAEGTKEIVKTTKAAVVTSKKRKQQSMEPEEAGKIKKASETATKKKQKTVAKMKQVKTAAEMSLPKNTRVSHAKTTKTKPQFEFSSMELDELQFAGDLMSALKKKKMKPQPVSIESSAERRAPDPCTHLIIGASARRTMKVIFAIVRGSWILDSNFLMSSVENEG
jgi:hypothetical protein